MHIMYGEVKTLQDMQQLPFIWPTPLKNERLKLICPTNELTLVLNHNWPMKQE